MTEWLILSLLVPAILVPAALIFGFAGCSFPGDPSTVTIASAVGTDEPSIVLNWSYDNPNQDQNYAEFERTKVSDSTMVSFSTASTPHTDNTGLEQATKYSYRARGVRDGAEFSEWSAPVLGEAPTFSALEPVAQDAAFGNVDARTVKCEIAAAELIVPSFAPTRLWITLGQRAEAVTDLGQPESIVFFRVFIGHKAPAGDPWDATSLTQVLFTGLPGTTVMPGATSRSDEIAFAWDRASDLILSMYFSGGDDADQLSARTTGPSNTHNKPGLDEADVLDATGYTAFPGYLSGVVRIEMA